MAAQSAHFKPVIRNDPSLSLGLYPKIKTPSSTITSAPSPTFVSSPEMKALLKSDSRASLSHVWGLTVGTFSLHFADAVKQWTKNSDGRWQFQGGDVELVVVNRIYIDKNMLGSEARLDSDVAGLIMTHELLHVQDNVEVVTKDGPAELTSDRVIRSLLIDGGKGEPGIVEEREYNHWVNDPTTDPNGNACSYLTSRMIGLLVDKLNAKAASRDSGPGYSEYGNNISFLLQTATSHGSRSGASSRSKGSRHSR
jgi:hypothetical protein